MTISNSKFSLNSFAKKVIIKSSIFFEAAFLVYFLISNTASITAQDKKGYIGISLGPSLPIGDFASKNFSNTNAGFATNGAIFDISFAYKLGKSNFGITGLIRGQANALDHQAMADELGNSLRGTNWTVESGGAWSLGGYFIGGIGSFPVSEKVSFDTKAMIGIGISTIPEITITSSDNFGSYWTKQSSTTSSSLAYTLGVGFKFELGKSLYLLTNLDYLGSEPEFQNIDIVDSDGDRTKFTYKQSIRTINLSIGIALKI
jgi:hypothetical protein